MLASVLILAASTAAVVAQSTSTVTSNSTTTSPTGVSSVPSTISLVNFKSGFAGSVVHVDGCGTTLDITCTDSRICSGATPSATIMLQPSKQVVLADTSLDGQAATVSISCTMTGPQSSATEATCHESASVKIGKAHTSVVTDLSFTSDVPYGVVTITANADALTSTDAVCTKSDGAAAPTAVAIRDVFKVIVPVGAAIAALA